jgi:tetratricopeptide (TPR) repeat protein
VKIAALLFLLPALVLAQSPSFDALAKRAEAARAANDFDQAISLYQRATKLRPSWNEGWWYLGMLYYEQDRYPEARDSFRRLLNLGGKTGIGWTMLGLCEFQTRQYDLSLMHLLKGDQFGIAHAEQFQKVSNYYVVLLLTREGKYEEALQRLAVIGQGGGQGNDYIEAAGIAGLRKPMLPVELPAAERELVMDTGQAVFLSLTRHAKEAGVQFETLIKKYPATPNVHFLYGAFLIAEDADKALLELKRELEIQPHHLPSLLSLATEYVRREQPADALPFAREAVESAPNAAPARLTLGRVLVKLGQIDEGIQQLETAVRISPVMADSHFALGTAYQQAGRKLDAQRERAEFARLTKTAPAEVSK